MRKDMAMFRKTAALLLTVMWGFFWGDAAGIAQQQEPQTQTLEIKKIRPPEQMEEPTPSPALPVREVRPAAPRSEMERPASVSVPQISVRAQRDEMLRPGGIGTLGRVDRAEGVIVIGDSLLPLTDDAVFFSGSLGMTMPSSEYKPGVQIAYEKRGGAVSKVWLYKEVESRIQRE